MTSLRKAFLVACGCLLVVAALAGCGQASGGAHTHASAAVGHSGRARGGAQSTSTGGAASSDPRAHGAEGEAAKGKGVAAEVADPEEAQSFPVHTSHHNAASTPRRAAEEGFHVAAGAQSNAEVERELNEMHAVQHAAQTTQRQELTPLPGGESVGGNGTIPIPTNVPAVVARVIAGGNAIADFPYVFGGGHASFVSNAYDCSGSVSYALAAGGLVSRPMVSGELADWGEPGPGQWITIYANAGHTFMDVDGWWFDTAGRSGPYTSRWLVAQPPLEGYAVRHPPGL